jgi:cystathionine beta-synthase
MQSTGISQLPVLEEGKPVGSIQELTLARVLHDNRDPILVTVSEIMVKPLPQLDVSTHLDEAYRLLLAGNTGVLAVANGKVIDIVTRIDLVQYWDQARKGEAVAAPPRS